MFYLSAQRAKGTIMTQATCQHANTEERPALQLGEQPTDLFCGAPADAWKLPDTTTGFYCNEHGPQVVERVSRRINRQEGRA